jgi:hypothetical protein
MLQTTSQICSCMRRAKWRAQKFCFPFGVLDFGVSFFKITSLVSSSLPVYLSSVPHRCLHICIPRSSRFLQFSNRLKQPPRFSTNFSCNQKFFKSNLSLNLLTAERSNSQRLNDFFQSENLRSSEKI